MSKVIEIQPDKRFHVYFRLAVYATRKSMITAIKDYFKEVPSYPLPDEKTMGMFCPMPCIESKYLQAKCYPNMFGTMFINLEDVNTEVIAHECAHAAFSREFNIRHCNGDFSDDNMEEQEEFCYFLGRATKIVTETIKKYFKGVKL